MKTHIRLDASALKESSCSRRLVWTTVDGYREEKNSNDIEFGSAFHEFIKVMKETNGNYAEATMAAVNRYNVPMYIKDRRKDYMTAQYLQVLCFKYWEQYVAKDQFETVVIDGKPLVELKFSYPYYVDDEVEVSLCGTIDDVCKHRHGTYAIRDYKTTSVYKKDEYLSGYALSPQLMFYRMVVSLYAKTYPDSIFAQINKHGFSCFIEGVFLQGATKEPEFKRSELFIYTPEQMNEFQKLVDRKVRQLVELVKAGVVPDREGMINGACQTVYGPCKFAIACKQQTSVGVGHMLNRFFIKREYNPLAFGKEHENKNKETQVA